MIIKRATDSDEFEKIHQLNYKIFVEEIPQHVPNGEKILIDKFHDKNHYIIAKREAQLLGMVCYNWERPFSLEGKIGAVDNYLPKHSKLAEIRLLSVEISERKTTVAYRLLKYLCNELVEYNTDAAIISATTRQLKLYHHIGFIPFGPLVGTADALYQPMYITLKDIRYDFSY